MFDLSMASQGINVLMSVVTGMVGVVVLFIGAKLVFSLSYGLAYVGIGGRSVGSRAGNYILAFFATAATVYLVMVAGGPSVLGGLALNMAGGTGIMESITGAVSGIAEDVAGMVIGQLQDIARDLIGQLFRF